MTVSSDKTLSLTFNEVEALLSAIVDCDPALHQKLEKFVDECKAINKFQSSQLFKLFEDDILHQFKLFYGNTFSKSSIKQIFKNDNKLIFTMNNDCVLFEYDINVKKLIDVAVEEIDNHHMNNNFNHYNQFP